LGGEDLTDQVVQYYVRMINKKYGKDIASGRHAMRKLRTEVGHLSLHTRARWRPFLRYPHSEDGIHINLKYNLTVCAEDTGSSGKRAERRVTAENGMLSHEEIEGMLQAACEEKDWERKPCAALRMVRMSLFVGWKEMWRSI
jgi:molecular chaperone DnaK (HSP70)